MPLLKRGQNTLEQLAMRVQGNRCVQTLRLSCLDLPEPSFPPLFTKRLSRFRQKQVSQGWQQA